MPIIQKTTARQAHHPTSSSLRKGTPILKQRLTEKGKSANRSRKEQTNGSAGKDWNVPLVLDRDELMAMLQECLTDFATEVGLKVAYLLFDKRVDPSSEHTTPKRNRPRRRRSVAKTTR